MRKTWRKIVKSTVLVLSTILVIGIVAGCGKKTVSDKDEQGRTVISVGGWPTQAGATLDNVNARKERFEEANPDVLIQPDTWNFDRKTFYAKAAGKQLPTVFNTQYTEIPEIINSNYGADLTNVLNKRGYKGKFNEMLLDTISKDGRIYAFPTSAYVLGLPFNTEMFEAAGLLEVDGTPKQPKDWYELVEFAVKIKEATGKAGIVFPTANKNGGWIFTPVAWSFGVEFMEKDENGKWHATFNTPEAADALQYIKDLKWKYDVLPSNTLIDNVEYYQTFATGGAGMMIAAGDIGRYLVQYGMQPEQIGMMALPAGPKRHITLLGGGVTCISENATEDQIDAAIRWLEARYNFIPTEEYKTNYIANLENSISENQIVGIKGLSIWSSESESVQWEWKTIDEKTNANPNHFRLYNEFVKDCPAEIQAEEPVCAQELYEILDGCIQEVLTNQNADCTALLEKANSDFQANYLDNLDY